MATDFCLSLGCVVAYFLFSEGKEIFFNLILSGWERCKLFCKLWSVLGIVRLANVLTPVRWLFCIVLKKVDTFFIDNPTTSLQFIC